MSLDDHRESVWAYRELMRAAEREIRAGGEIKPALARGERATRRVDRATRMVEETDDAGSVRDQLPWRFSILGRLTT